MRLVVISHKPCWTSPSSTSGFATDGGFPLQVRAISELFDETAVVVPVGRKSPSTGESPLEGRNLKVKPVTSPMFRGLLRKLTFPFWSLRNFPAIFAEIIKADAVHTPIPGDVGTVGLLLALVLRKPLFVRHCGNWLVQRSAAENLWKWGLERIAGGRNVVLATGGATAQPSKRNSNISWVFSTGIRKAEIRQTGPRTFPARGPRLVTACRIEPRKGTAELLEALPLLVERWPDVSLQVIGGGSLLPELQARARELGLADRVIFHGKVSHASVLQLLDKSDLFCFPTTASEGFPKVVVEALSCGLPVVTTPVSVLPELMQEGCGVLLDDTSATAVAEGIGSVLVNKQHYANLSAAALNVAQRLTLETWQDTIGDHLCRAWGPLKNL